MVTATGNITADGENSEAFPSGIFSTVDTFAFGEERNAINRNTIGDSGGVIISTNNLNLTNGGEVSASTFARGNAGPVDVTATGDITADGETSRGATSGITSRVFPPALGDAGGVIILTNNLILTAGGNVSANTFGQGNANNVTIEATESIIIDGFIEGFFRSGISANALNQDGNGGNIFINTGKLSVANGGTIEATNFDDIGGENPGTGRPGSINIAAENIELTDNARIETATQFAGGESGIINLQVAENIIFKNNSFISAKARNNADGGNINIDSRFIIAFPSDGNGNDIIANAQDGVGGNIQINSTLLGIRQNSAEPNNRSNDIDASSRFNIDGNITINTLDNDLIQATTELSTDLVVPEKTREQACRVNRDLAVQNGLYITGKGGIPHDPGNTLNSFNTYVDGELTSVGSISAPIETVQGKIQPARGIGVTKSGEIILTAYRTNNSGDRLPKIRNCV